MALLSRDSWPLVAARTVFCTVLFILGALSLRGEQMVAWGLLHKFPRWYYAVINYTKLQFLYLITFITAFVSPCKVKVSFRKSDLPEDNSFRVDIDGNLFSNLSKNAVFIANHQIYTDWVFFWYLSYTSNLANSMYIVTKDSLAKVPVLGMGMQAFRFLFLLRKWETDKVNLTNRLLEIDAEARGVGPAAGVSHVASINSSLPGVKQWPKGKAKNEADVAHYQLVIFPEGTVISPHTRERSDKYVVKMEREKLKHLLLPRARGLFLMLRLLRNTVDTVYDVAYGYSGLKPGDYGEEVYTLKAMYLKGFGPPAINYHIRSFNIKDIPLGDDDNVDIDKVDPEVLRTFENWLFDIWYEKDELMERFFDTGTFGDPKDSSLQTVVADLKLRSVSECVSPFVAPAALSLIVYQVIKFAVRFFAKDASPVVETVTEVLK